MKEKVFENKGIIFAAVKRALEIGRNKNSLVPILGTFSAIKNKFEDSEITLTNKRYYKNNQVLRKKKNFIKRNYQENQ